MSIALTLLLLMSPPERDALSQPVFQTMSLLGDSLFTVELDEATFRSNEFRYIKALRRYDKNPDDVDNLIWLGRRLGYLGRFRDAVDLYTTGIETWPDDPRLYRHRGHRHISLREFDKAVADLEQAAALMPDSLEVEPDGLPNEANVPTSTLQFNVWYHLGLAHYLRGDHQAAAEAYAKCLEVSNNNECQVSVRYWMYLNQAKMGSSDPAVLEPVVPNMYLLENEDYHRMGLVLSGTFPPDSARAEDPGSLSGATRLYGLAMWYELNDDPARADSLKHSILGPRQWSAFGAIAAEADLARRAKQ